MSDQQPFWSKPRAVGFALPLLYGLVVYAIVFVEWGRAEGPAIIVGSLLFPLSLGSAVQLLWDPRKTRRMAKVWANSLMVTAMLSAILLALLVETVVCILMALPIFAVMQFIGVWLARKSIPDIDGKQTAEVFRVSLLGLPLLALILPNPPGLPVRHEVLRSEITIAAPPETVWRHTLEIPEIGPEERIWTFSHMILRTPQARDAVLVGDIRQLRWTKGVRFQEHIVAAEENRRLDWRFVFNEEQTLLGFDPHIRPAGRELHLIGGGYVLEETAPGQTRLRLETRYRLRTPFNVYLAWWGELFLSDFHQSVLAVIKQRAEADA